MITRLELRDMDTFTLGRLRKEGLGICGSNSNGNGRRGIMGGSASGNSGPAVRGWCVATERECCKAEEGVGGNL